MSPLSQCLSSVIDLLFKRKDSNRQDNCGDGSRDWEFTVYVFKQYPIFRACLSRSLGPRNRVKPKQKIKCANCGEEKTKRCRGVCK